MLATRIKSTASRKGTERLIAVEKQLRAALAGAPRVQQLFQEWIELRLSPAGREGLCQRR
jgi:hypothetical protein